MRHSSFALFVLAVVAAFLPAAAGARPISFGESETATALQWTACDGGYQCATLSVPLDYANAASGAISLGIVRRTASDPARRIGVLFMNPGGPGGSAVELVERISLPGEVMARFDLIGVDPRGVGRTEPISCHSTMQAYFAADPSPDTEAEWLALEQAAAAFTAECTANHAALLPHVGTRNVARDMERVRIALGEERISYLGYSYGTTLGAVYADMFPGRLRAMVLDGAYDFFSFTGDEQLRRQSVGFEGALDAFLANCTGTCPLARGGSPRSQLDLLLARVEQSPIPAPGADRPLGPGEANVGISLGLYSRGYWPMLATAVSNALAGDGTLLVAMADIYLNREPDGSYPGANDVYIAVSCLDYAWPSTTAAFRPLAAQAIASAPHFGAPNLLQSALPCANWPAPSEPLTPPHAEGAPPILVIATTNDPATPYAEGVRHANQLATGVLLTHVGEGHTVYGHGNSCIDSVVNAYLVSLTVPADGASCEPGRSTPTPPPPAKPARPFSVVLPEIAAG